MGRWSAARITPKCLLLILANLLALTNAGSEELFAQFSNLDQELVRYVDDIFSDSGRQIDVVPGICIERKSGNFSNVNSTLENCSTSRGIDSVEEYFSEKWDNFAKTHVLAMNVPETARFFFSWGQQKSSFMAGFGMGFMAFFLKKLLLPVFIIAQIAKSVLIAMFLPSILGSLGKLVGKGLSNFSGISGHSSLSGGGAGQEQDFEFKDTSPYNNDVNGDQDFNVDPTFNTDESTMSPQAMNRLSFGNQRVSFVPPSNIYSENYYVRQPQKKTDYKVFHKIPQSSLLLTTYDPFYSPLLSRLDAVFQQLGLPSSKSAQTEKCRERLVCMMYANPAKFAPYSNLVSAQLSRDLNELRKPTSDNPEILRFFRYMKAAKDGQDGEECLQHTGCSQLNSQQLSPAMLTTFNDINKLVQARKLS